MADLNALVEGYGRFEQSVRQVTEKWCHPFCSHCRRICCRIHFCEETRQSPFLSRVAALFSPAATFDPAQGWLSANGCRLLAGRPPVCYEFLCRDISMVAAVDADHLHALMTLSMLLTHVGRRAVGGRHLVAVMRDADLERIREDRFMAHLSEAQAAFHAAVAVLDGHPSQSVRQTMSVIVPLPSLRPRRRMR